jgi:hypothetical protein
MKHIMMLMAASSVALGAGYGLYPEEAIQAASFAAMAIARLWDNIQANPAPVLFALGTFLLTVIYHKARGKSLSESVEAAATRVTVAPAPLSQGEPLDRNNPVTKRAKARATRAQLLVDQIGLQNRQRKLPEEIAKAEKEACYSQQALADAQKTLAAKQEAHKEAVARLETLRKENGASKAELAEIAKELEKLAEVI